MLLLHEPAVKKENLREYQSDNVTVGNYMLYPDYKSPLVQSKKVISNIQINSKPYT